MRLTHSRPRSISARSLHTLAIALSMVLGLGTAFAQGSAAPPAGSAATGSAGSAAPATGSATGSAAPAESVPVPAPAPTAPAVDPAARQRICEQALANPPGGDTRFVGDAQSYALGQMAAPQLAKTPEGQACMDAIGGVNDFRSAVSTLAQEREAKRLAAEVEQQHEQAAAAIAKNEKHVVMAYAALWLLAAGFLLFLWRRQQHLKVEIANLKRDLEAATK